MTEKVQIKTPLVSVVIPTYNRSKELARAIKSVLNQTYQNFEILVVDDGSEEDLRVVYDTFNDQRIRFLRNDTHTNANVARNRGIKEAQGEYIAMLDSDDEYLPHHLNRRIEKIREWGCDGIFGSAYIYNGEEQTLKLSRPLKKGELMINYLLSDGFAPTPSHFYKANAAKAVLWDETLLRHQDYDFSVRFAEKYIFNSDYEPTNIINWQQEAQWKAEYWQSCKAFINKNKAKINPKNLYSYLCQITSKGSKTIDRNDEIHFRWIARELDSMVNFISLTDYIQFSHQLKFSKVRSTLKYFILLLTKR
jgi:glycosyltransferase involved in cell wall biosynthesis